MGPLSVRSFAATVVSPGQAGPTAPCTKGLEIVVLRAGYATPSYCISPAWPGELMAKVSKAKQVQNVAQ